MHILISSWMLFLVIELHPTHFIAFYWMLIRLTERSIKHIYNIYIQMGLRFELIWIDYFRFTSFYVLYPMEVICSYVVLYFMFPFIKRYFSSFSGFKFLPFIISYSIPCSADFSKFDSVFKIASNFVKLFAILKIFMAST